MSVFEQVKSPAVKFMTELENCRTQIDYDNSFVMKLWIIGFVNGFAALFYNAFVKVSIIFKILINKKYFNSRYRQNSKSKDYSQLRAPIFF